MGMYCLDALQQVLIGLRTMVWRPIPPAVISAPRDNDTSDEQENSRVNARLCGTSLRILSRKTLPLLIKSHAPPSPVPVHIHKKPCPHRVVYTGHGMSCHQDRLLRGTSGPSCSGLSPTPWRSCLAGSLLVRTSATASCLYSTECFLLSGMTHLPGHYYPIQMYP